MATSNPQPSSLNCINCQKFPTKWPCSEFITFEHYGSFKELDGSAAAGCSLCRILRQALAFEADPKQLIGTSSPVIVQISGRSTISVCINTSTDPSSSSFGPYGLLEVIEASAAIGHNLASGCNIRGFHPAEQAHDLKYIVKSLIQPWMVSCCKETSVADTKSQKQLPTRVIDVDSAPGCVRLVETNGHSGPYIILSYCWGKGNDRARTTKTNLDERKQSIKIDGLPKTIQQAIEVTKQLGIRHLWVDAICIIQAESSPPLHDELEDWRLEAPKMGQYYGNALLTIAATAATDSEDGFVVERPSQRFSVSPCRIGSWIKDSEPISDAMLVPGTPSITNQVHYGPLYTRSWTLQERVLSLHTVHWCRDSVFWECRGCIKATESQPTLPSSKEPSVEAQQYSWAIVTSQSRENTAYFNEFWLDLIEDYAQMYLSFESDRLIAIQGLVTQLRPSSHPDDAYIAGIFKSGILNGLAWSNSTPRNGKIDSIPSWSWASLSAGNLEFEHLEGKFVKMESVNDFDVLRRDPRLNGRLKLSCPLQEIHTALIQDDVDGRFAIIDSSYPFKVYFQFDAIGNSLKHQGKIFLLPLGWKTAYEVYTGTTKSNRLVLGLLLRPTGHNPGDYKRIGIFRVRELVETRKWEDAPRMSVNIF